MGIIEQIAATERYYERRIAELEQEVEHWKDKHWESVTHAIKHNEEMSGLILCAALEAATAKSSALQSASGSPEDAK